MKNILFLCNADEGWMGGVYYVRNMIFALLQNDAARKNLNIYILAKNCVAEAFRDLEKEESVHSSIHRQLNLIKKFDGFMNAAGFSTRVFNPAGQDDIGGGCGQLWYFQEWLSNNRIK